jgi:hypothetical protein
VAKSKPNVAAIAQTAAHMRIELPTRLKGSKEAASRVGTLLAITQTEE